MQKENVHAEDAVGDEKLALLRRQRSENVARRVDILVQEILYRSSSHPGSVDDAGFFFSSRGRHTLSTRDWSSDVCSSDLNRPRPPGAACSVRLAASWSWTPGWPWRLRSEERRVGKECRSGWSPCN